MGSRGQLVTLSGIHVHWGPCASGTFRDIWKGGSRPRRKQLTHPSLSTGGLHLTASWPGQVCEDTGDLSMASG